jgi:hypothetical protein
MATRQIKPDCVWPRASVLCAALICSAFAAAACDAGPRADEAEATTPIAIVGLNVGADLPAAPRGSVQIAFDSFLNPFSALRQSVALRDSSGFIVDSPLVTYDPVTRVLALRNPASEPAAPGAANRWLRADQFYTVALGIPEAGAELGGVRAVDGATLDPKATRRFGFFVRESASVESVQPTLSFCRDVQPAFTQKCGGSGCHGTAATGASSPSAQAALGLVLDSAAGVRAAVGSLAREANTGPRSGEATPAPRIFALDMPVVDAGNPGNSWLVYKVLSGAFGTRAAAPTCGVPAVLAAPAITAAGPASASARERLSSQMVGRSMPPAAGENALTWDETRRLSLWIAQGAIVDNCASCTNIVRP